MIIPGEPRRVHIVAYPVTTDLNELLLPTRASQSLPQSFWSMSVKTGKHSITFDGRIPQTISTCAKPVLAHLPWPA